MKFVVLMQNVTPYHSSAPGAAYVDLSGNFVAKAPGAFPCVRTRQMPAIVGLAEGEFRRVHLPIMPANSLRHELRAGILEAILDAFRGKYTLSPRAYASAWCGNASGTPEGITATFAEIAAIQRHPFLGLFGGGPRMIEGKLMVDNAWAWTGEALDLMPPEAHEWINTGRLTEIVWKRRMDPITQASEDAAEIIEGGAEAITEWSVRANLKPAKGKKNEEEAAESDEERGLRAFNAHEVVIPGARFTWTIGTKRPLTDQQLGAVLWGIQQMHGRHLGGMSALGYGKVAIKNVLIDGESVWEGEAIQHGAIDAFIEALDGITPDDFETFAAAQGEK